MRFIKKSIFVCLLLTMAVPAHAAVTLKYADHDPPTGPKQVAIKEWFKEIEKETNGRVKIQPFFGGSLGKSTETLKLVKDGSVAMGFIFPDFYPQQLVAHNIFKLFPIGPESWSGISKVYEDVYEEIPEFKEEFLRQGQVPLLILSAMPGIMCATYPVKSLDDLKGKKWRASSRWHLAMLKHIGATPVSVPWSDVYMALQTGTIDGVLTDMEGMYITKLDEAAKNIFASRATWFGSPFVHTINKKVWENLSEEDRQGILRASETIRSTFFGPVFEEEFDVIIKHQKGPVHMWTKEDLSKWGDADLLKQLRAQWVKEASGLNLADPQSIMDTVDKIITKRIQ